MTKIELNSKKVRKEILMAYINRAIEPLLLQKYQTYKCVAVTGARQVGKTRMSKELFPGVRRINLKNQSLLSAANEDPQGFMESFARPLFVDEVQECPKVLGSVKDILDNVTGYGNYLFSGSQKWSLMEGLSDSLSGMVGIIELAGLSLREIKQIKFNQRFIPTEQYLKAREKELQKYNDIWQIIHRGSYPELYEHEEKDWEEFYQDYVQTYIEKDVYKITKIRDYQTFYKFLVSVAARTGQILDYTNIASDIEVSVDTVKAWIGILVKTDIVYLLQPYYNSHLNRAIKSPKLYFRDTGLASYLTSWLTPETLRNGAISGHMFETFVVNEIIKSFINVGKDYTKYIYYYHGKDKVKKKKVDIEGNVSEEMEESEIDIIIEENGTLYPLEIKKGSNPTASDADAFTVLDKDIDKKRGTGAVICTGEYKLKLRDNLYSLPIEYI